MSAAAPVVLFGAFDRHNFGDLLLAHVAAAMLADRPLAFAGLADRDLRAYGGHRVRAIGRLAGEWGECPVNVLHVGGEIVDCDSWEAAVMLQEPAGAQRVVARLDREPVARRQWASEVLEQSALAPYCLSRGEFPAAMSVIYQAAGGSGLAGRDPALRAEVLQKLLEADSLTVRDVHTRAFLASQGIDAPLLPDAAVMARECFGERIARHGERGEVATMRRAFPDGFVAVQFSADFADDATLAELAGGLRRIARATGWGIGFFRAGAAPWHDEIAVYERILGRLDPGTAALFRPLSLWDICALVARSRAYIGSSLHGRILAMAYGLPRLGLRHSSPAVPVKQAAFATTWDVPGLPGAVAPADLPSAWDAALAASHRLDEWSQNLTDAYRRGFDTLVRSHLR